jgi:site-specific recombinase XerD
MSDLIAVRPAPSLALLQDDIDTARGFIKASNASSTRRAYLSDFRIFTAYCVARGAAPLPASVDTVVAFLSAEATGGAKTATLARRVAAIRYAHKTAGLEPPTNAEAIKAVMSGIRRTMGAGRDQKSPATADRLRDMLDLCPDTMRGQRDRALLALGFAGAFRRSELVALLVEDLAEAPDGFRVTIRHSKTDQEGQGQEIAVPHGASLRPVEAVQTWLEASGITSGAIFRSVRKNGVVSPLPLSDGTVADIVKSYAALVGLDPALFAGHSLRAGFLTSGAEAGASIWKLMEVSRHKSVDTLRGYVRRADLFKDHAGAKFL